MTDAFNRDLYAKEKAADELVELPSGSRWDREIVRLRLTLVEQYGRGGDVLDLCCGTGSYLLPNVDAVGTATALDFSHVVLGRFAKELHHRRAGNVALVEADATRLPLRSAAYDFVYSYASLYIIPGVDRVLDEVARVLRPGGYAALELGNRRSLNMAVVRAQHVDQGWAEVHAETWGATARQIHAAGLDIVEDRALQLLPMYGAPRRLRWMAPLLSARWKNVLGTVVGGRTADEWVSSRWPVRHLAWRHLVIARKPGSTVPSAATRRA